MNVCFDVDNLAALGLLDNVEAVSRHVVELLSELHRRLDELMPIWLSAGPRQLSIAAIAVHGDSDSVCLEDVMDSDAVGYTVRW